MLPPGGSCLLGSINLSEFVTKDKLFDFEDFSNTVDVAIKALNEVLDEGIPLHPLKEQRESVRDWRQCGLGIFGLADMLIKMGVRYGSDESIHLCDMIGQKMAYQAIKTSAELAKIIGHYPKYHPEAVAQSAFFTKHVGDTDTSCGLANSQLLTIAPTGTLSTMLGVSGGIEPIFANYYTRKTESLHGHDEYYKVYTPIVKDYMDKNNLKDDSELPKFFITAQELDYKERIKMQAIWQKHIDASISSTVNVPNDFTVKEVEDLYMRAWESGLKGVTIFRDGCKRAGILTLDNKKEDKKDEVITNSSPEYTLNTLPRGFVIKADDNVIGKKRTLKTGCGTLHCEAFFDPVTGELLETYFSKGSEGGCNSFMVGLSRMISLAARTGVSLEDIIDQLRSTPVCASYAVRAAKKHDTSKGNCCPSAIGLALKDMYNEMQEELDIDEDDVEEYDEPINTTSEHPEKTIIKQEVTERCPECGEPLIHIGGCDSCSACGYSHCG